MRLHWQPVFSTSCLHAAWALLSGRPLVEAEKLEAAIGEPAWRLAAEIQEAGVPEDQRLKLLDQ